AELPKAISDVGGHDVFVLDDQNASLVHGCHNRSGWVWGSCAKEISKVVSPSRRKSSFARIWLVSSRIILKPSVCPFSTSKSGGRPTPSSLTESSNCPDSEARRATRKKPARPDGKACWSALETSSLAIKPRGMAWPMCTHTGSVSVCNRTFPDALP